MTKNVFAGMWEIAAENGMNKSIARFPDVCMSPPSPPAGPIPIPYPDTSFSNNLKSGSSTVLIGGKAAALAQQSYYQEPVLGDEAATRTFGANVVTHQITGKTYFQAWCMDVKFEGKNVCRHLDITTSNHASEATTTAPLVTAETQSTGGGGAKGEQRSMLCECCGNLAHSAAQLRGESITEEEFYNPSQTGLRSITGKGGKQTLRNLDLTPKQRAQGQRGLNDAQGVRELCPDQMPPKDGPCSKYYRITPAEKEAIDTHYENFARNDNPFRPASWKGAKMIAHRVPRSAGGCPTGPNTSPVFDDACKDLDGTILSDAQQFGYETALNHSL
ncbi:MAG: DUF4150 domain-containing protein [Hyphomicrobiales bacterium]|nr:MAG: DUF4150 domain-containing protein [Hyphomicrobiales bacterium]